MSSSALPVDPSSSSSTSPHLHPIIIPDFAYSPSSPSETGYHSPAESDSLRTPSFHEQPHLLIRLPTNSDSPLAKHDISADHYSQKEDSLLPSLLLNSRSMSHDSPPLSPANYDDSPIHEPSPKSMSDNDNDSSYLQRDLPHSYSATSSPSPSHSTPVKSVHKSQNTYPPYSGTSSSRSGASLLNLDSHLHSPHFPRGHQLNTHFVRIYQLEDELGSGGYGFVMTAKHRSTHHEVAVKFIIKEKVPQHAWMEHEMYGRLPTEVMLLSVINHENIVKCLDLFEDSLYFYLVQELHGSPWQSHQVPPQPSVLQSSPSIPALLPSLTPSVSVDSLSSSCPSTPDTSLLSLSDDEVVGVGKGSKSMTLPPPRPKFNRRASHDLFECIEQSEHKRLTEDQARHVFMQIVDAVHYLDAQGVAHRDIKDENIVIDGNLKVKLIDFGSATFVDPSEPRPYYTLFYGTTAYASSEILLKKPYQAAPAEVWTLGVLLSYLLTGSSPFPTVKDAIAGRIGLTNWRKIVSSPAMSLLKHCLDPNPKTRATIEEIKVHPWLHGQS
ncbi:hypothetical protein E1B28_000461 [Marasmius oreades]|uniref:Protein kinase domain-containing protein n=1 Tax=Marasmius oreades TaxID=181124 RepID=A0A9P8AED2_9AGAR|nr:uncharacterized protein E1B28_000461 [Marasmius oreades]KAG7098517.1 hypothetical protein E1B28_000461 [Marasmius oreades]